MASPQKSASNSVPPPSEVADSDSSSSKNEQPEHQSAPAACETNESSADGKLSLKSPAVSPKDVDTINSDLNSLFGDDDLDSLFGDDAAPEDPARELGETAESQDANASPPQPEATTPSKPFAFQLGKKEQPSPIPSRLDLDDAVESSIGGSEGHVSSSLSAPAKRAPDGDSDTGPLKKKMKYGILDSDVGGSTGGRTGTTSPSKEETYASTKKADILANRYVLLSFVLSDQS